MSGFIKMFRFSFLVVAFLFIGGKLSHAQTIGLKSNLLYLGTTTPNLGVEGRLADQWSLSFTGSYNPFLFPQWEEDGGLYNPKLIHWALVPEVKFWPCRVFERSFIGIHGIYGQFNVGAIPFIEPLKYVRYSGEAYGGGISYGYHWAIGGRWGLELSAGVGYLHMRYNKCDAEVCSNNSAPFRRDYIGPTKLALTFVYFIH